MRDEWGRVLASLVGFLGDFDRAEEAAQEAFTVAAERWSAADVPANPGAWLVATARRRALDRIRRERALAGKVHLLLPEATVAVDDFDDLIESGRFDADGTASIRDERLELLFTCCHPALAPEARAALTLRALGGLATADIARALLVPEETVRRRLTRAKAKIRATAIPFAVPGAHRLSERLDAVLSVIHLIYNEGCRGRVDLGAEALRLGRVLTGLLPREPEAHGLLALMTLHHARRRARFPDADDGDSDGDGDGRGGGAELVLLQDQDRSLWDRQGIAAGRAVLDGAVALGGPVQHGPYVLQAAIAALQTRERVDWPQVARLYGRLAALTGSPVVQLNRAAAIARAGAPHTALRLIGSLDLDGCLYLHSTRGELLRRLGHTARARAAYGRALDLATTAPERRFLARRLEEL
ncbi:RNA polymerase sigma factor [Streptomyces synnematoformans]|uniref:RNA polymerase sigma factor n=1 Tax=Streptomyces synnematoformans TaxID=415721 RepID=A0ABP4K969_9ACTN